jgi:hypothetical protein
MIFVIDCANDVLAHSTDIYQALANVALSTCVISASCTKMPNVSKNGLKGYDGLGVRFFSDSQNFTINVKNDADHFCLLRRSEWTG